MCRNLIMSNFLLSADIAMAMGIFPDNARRKLMKKPPKRRENNGHKSNKQVQQSKEIIQREKEQKWGRVVIPPDKNNMKLEHL